MPRNHWMTAVFISPVILLSTQVCPQNHRLLFEVFDENRLVRFTFCNPFPFPRSAACITRYFLICHVCQQLIYLFPPTEIVPPSVWMQFVCTLCKLIVGFLVALSFMFKSQLSNEINGMMIKWLSQLTFPNHFPRIALLLFAQFATWNVLCWLYLNPHVFTVFFLWSFLTYC